MNIHFDHHHAHYYTHLQMQSGNETYHKLFSCYQVEFMFSGFTCGNGDTEVYVRASPLRPSPRLRTNQTLYCIYDIPDNETASITVQWYMSLYETRYTGPGLKTQLIWTAANSISNSVNEAADHDYKNFFTGSTVNFPDLRHGHSITFHGIYRGGLYFCELKVKFTRSHASWVGKSPWIVVTIDCKHLCI